MLKGGENDYFRINSGVRQVCIMSPWLQCIYGYSDEGGENGDGEEGSGISGGGKIVEIVWSEDLKRIPREGRKRF